MKKLVSGIKPTGDIHLGNYFGAMKQFVELQDNYDSNVFIADYHALNQIHNGDELRKNILEITKAYLAVGLDPKKVNIYKQSDNNFHTELCWIFNSITPMALLLRSHAFKDASAKNKSINLGVFDYPVLMAADILIYDADVVPVGKDQKQHIEITQGIARTFNKVYSPTFKIPEGLILDDVAIIKGLDGRKMSKSYSNVIGLFEKRENLAKKVMSIVTDSKGPSEPKDPETCNIFYYHSLISEDKRELNNLRNRYLEGSISYKESKEMLLEKLDQFLTRFRKKKEELDSSPEYIYGILNEGQKKVFDYSYNKMQEVKRKIGVL